MAKPVSYAENPAGGVDVQFDDGTSNLFDPNHPAVAPVLLTLPQAPALRDAIDSSADPMDSAVADNKGFTVPEWWATGKNQKAKPLADVMSGYGIGAVPPQQNAPRPQAQPLDAVIGRALGTQPASTGPQAFNAVTGQMEAATTPKAEPPQGLIMAPRAPATDEPQGEPMPMPRIIPGTPGTLIKGGRVPQSWSMETVGGMPVSQELKDQQQSIEDQLQNASDTALGAATTQQEYETAMANELAAYKAEQEKARVRLQESRDMQMAELSDRVAETAKVDPQRLWKSQNTAAKFMAAMVDGLDSFLAIRTGRPKSEFATIDNLIKQDTDSQLRDHENAQQAVKDLYSQWQGDDARRAAVEAAHYENADQRLKAVMGGVRNQEKLAKAQEMSAYLQQQALDRKLKLMELERGQVTTQQHDVMTPDRVVGGSAPRIDVGETAAWAMRNNADLDVEKITKMQESLQKAGVPRDQAALIAYQSAGGGALSTAPKDGQNVISPENFVPGQGYARTKEEARDARALIAAKNQFVANIEALRQIREGGFTNRIPLLGSKAETLANQHQKILNQLLVDMGGMGALSDGDVKHQIGELSVPHVNDLMSRDSTQFAALDNARAVVEGKVKAKLDAMGLLQGHEALKRGGKNVAATATGVAKPATTPGTARFTQARGDKAK